MNAPDTDVLEELALRVNETVPAWALRAREEIKRLRAEVRRLKADLEGHPRVRWKPLLSGLPDEESTVLLYSPGQDEEVWAGFLESGIWHDLGGMPVVNPGISHWAEWPEPPPPF